MRGMRFWRSCSATFLKLFTLAGLFAVSSVFAQGQINFHKPDFDTGKSPTAVAAADFDRDGHLDIVAANCQGNSISVLLNTGTGAFSRRTDYSVGGNPQAVITADFNHDGVPDVAVANHDTNTVSIFLGNGNGTLRALPAVAAGRGPNGLVAGDFNRDGKLDLAVLNQNDGTVSVYLGSGDGGFTHNADYIVGPTANGGFPAGIVAADFNHDGILDLAAANGTSRQVSILLGKTDGSFISTTAISLPFSVATGPMAAADFNQDGNIDLIVQSLSCDRGCSGLVLIFGGNGDGTFDQGHDVGVADAGVPMAVADLNGDHVPDVITKYSVALIDSAGIFTAPTHPLTMAPAGLGVAALVAGDFDGDGKQDIVAANFQDDTVSLLLGDGNGRFHQPLRYPVDEPNVIVAADLNGDGISDIVIGKEILNGLQIFFSNADGTLKPPVELATDMHVFQLGVADLNRDGFPDLVALGSINSDGFIRIILSRGDGTFRAPIDRRAGIDVLRSLALADFNGDGIPDVASLGLDLSQPGNSTLFLQTFLGNGDGTFRPPVNTPVGDAVGGIAVADFNHDGKMDAVVWCTNPQFAGNITVLLGNGDGTFRNSASYTGSAFLATADFDHDGNADFVSLPDLFLGNGDGTFRQIQGVFHIPGEFGPGGFAHVADMNSDGLPDVVVAAGSRVAVFINNGDGTFQSSASFTIGGAWDVALADLDSDGRFDIASVGGAGNRALSLLLSAGQVAPPVRDFRFVLNVHSLTVVPGQAATVTASATGLGSFHDQITFSCMGLPAGAACTFNPASLTASAGQTLTSTLTISTQAATTARLLTGFNGVAALALCLPAFGFIVAGPRARKNWKACAISALLLSAILFLGGCGSVGSTGKTIPSTPAGTFTVTINATSGSSPAIIHSQTISLVVQ